MARWRVARTTELILLLRCWEYPRWLTKDVSLLLTATRHGHTVSSLSIWVLMFAESSAPLRV